MLAQEESTRLHLALPLISTSPRSPPPPPQPAGHHHHRHHHHRHQHGVSRRLGDASAQRRGAKAVLHLLAIVGQGPQQQRPLLRRGPSPRVLVLRSPRQPCGHPDHPDHHEPPSRPPRERPAQLLSRQSPRPGSRHPRTTKAEAVSAVAASRPSGDRHDRHESPAADTSGNRRFVSIPQQPSYLPASLPSPVPAYLSARGNRTSSAAAAAAARDLPRRDYPPQDYPLQSPFRTRAPNRFPRLSAARLWNPTNSTPRAPVTRRRRPSTPPEPSVPVAHPAAAAPAPDDPTAAGAAGDYPLLSLSLPEQLQNRPGGDRVSLPRSVRHSYDEKRRSGFTPSPSPTAEPEAGPSRHRRPAPSPREDDDEEHLQARIAGLRSRAQSVTHLRAASFGLVRERPSPKGKGKAVAMASTTADHDEDPGRTFSKDLERGPDDEAAAAAAAALRHSLASLPDGIGSAISSSNSSIMGDPDQQAPDDDEWGPQHPCYPHLNPHVPLDSPEYATTRVIRIRRDWLAEGDLAPCFSNMYPEILDPAGLPEHEFRRVVEHINAELVPAFRPYAWRGLLDGVLGVLTGWLWEDLGLTGIKSRLRRLERWIEAWNADMERTVGAAADEGVVPPKIVPLRRTAYMTLDIQISDPEILPSLSTPGASRGGASIEPVERPAEAAA